MKEDLNMLRFIAFILFATSLTGCASLPAQKWEAVISKDEFTDKTTKFATFGEWTTGKGYLVTYSLNFYPFVGIQDGLVLFGIRSGGGLRIPTGTVQVRIDDNASWTISPEETPIVLSPVVPTINYPNMPHTPDLSDFQKQMTDNMIKMMSPYTATTGEKAKEIIKEMIAGKVIKYRIVGVNQAASTTGNVALDQSFDSVYV
jgi:hypothetical protein